MAVTPRFSPGKALVNYGGAQNRVMPNRSAMRMRSAAASNVTRPKMVSGVSDRRQVSLPSGHSVYLPAPRRKNVVAAPTTPRPSTSAGIGHQWVWRPGRGWVAAWLGGKDPRGAAYWAAYTPAAMQYEQARTENARQYALGSAAQRESALSDLYSQNASLAARGLANSGGVGQAYDRLGRMNAAALDALSRQYGDIAQQNLANQWYQTQLDLMNQAAADYQKSHPRSAYLQQYLKG